MPFNVTKHWYRPSLSMWMILCLPLAWLFGFITLVRRYLFKRGLLKTTTFPIPVIVVGNLTVGGTGKTPFVVWLAQLLQSHGYHPGIVSRGVGGLAHHTPYTVNVTDAAEKIGDEALLLANKTSCPIVICINRAAAVKQLLAQHHCDIVISDDGLQHYRLGRAIEIVMIDAKRGFGNKQLLPAGPLREPISRLATVDFIVINQGANSTEINLPFIKTHAAMKLQFTTLQSVKNPSVKLDLQSFAQMHVHAIAAIGHPEQFFATLKSAQMMVQPHAFTDHYLYKPQDIEFNDNLPVIMTEKDAVKCRSFASDLHWYLPVTANLTKEFETMLLSRIAEERSHDAAMDLENASASVVNITRNRIC